ncbi:hypothetical protein [Bradyrhizobium sp. Ai1a-2]|uniref:hypothetical protein n=1 Tax=Bradyrhizobium sp. Ai1a-2 TaxID=196490 RepID=UPI0004158859|nr:hypothetical protein [Bradyrhizobium sp. Ai1a-2]
MGTPKILDHAGNDRLWPFGATKNAAIQGLERAFRDSLTAGNRMKDHAANLRGSGKLTERGVADEARRFGREDVLPSVARGTVALQRARKSVTSRLAQLKPAAVDKQDLVSAFTRAEFRDRIRALPAVRREELLQRHIKDLSPEMIHALLEQVEFPWAADQDRLISPAMRDALTTSLIEVSHPEAAAELAELREAIAYVEPVVSKATGEIQSALAMNAVDFEKAVATEAAKEAPVWLKRQGDKTVVLVPHTEPAYPGAPVRPNEFRARAATEADLLNGEYYADSDAWRAACAAAA